jgi:DNA-binding HxlR family transcriptional regulator
MAGKTYYMYCAVARALEILGERWTLLVVRELLTGPKRYADLLDGLPGIASNMLTDRLRGLTEAGAITQHRLPPPAASTVYELTERGRQLKPVLLTLGGWGLPLLADPRPGEQFRLDWLMIALDGFYRPDAVPTRTTVVFDIAGEIVTITAHGAEHTVTPDAAPDPDLTVSATTREPFLAWITGRSTDREAIAAGLSATGGTRGLRRLRGMYPLPRDQRPAATTATHPAAVRRDGRVGM